MPLDEQFHGVQTTPQQNEKDLEPRTAEQVLMLRFRLKNLSSFRPSCQANSFCIEV